MFYRKKIKLLEDRLSELESAVLKNENSALDPIYKYEYQGFQGWTFGGIRGKPTNGDITFKNAIDAILNHLGLEMNYIDGDLGHIAVEEKPKKKKKKNAQ